MEMGDDGNKPENEGDKKVVHVYPLVKVSQPSEISITHWGPT